MTPPRATRALLAALLGRRGTVELEEMDELYRHRARAQGGRKARRWYRQQVWGSMRSWRTLGVRSRAARGEEGAMAGARRGRTVVDEVGHALRVLRRRPAAAAFTVATLALGIGSTTAVFSLVEGIVLRPLPFEEPDRLLRVWSSLPESGLVRFSVSPLDYRDWSERAQSLSALAAYDRGQPRILGGDGTAAHVTVAAVDPALFALLGAPAGIGRALTADDGERSVVVLGHDLWVRAFGADTGIVGTSVRLDGAPHEVVGVMGPRFELPGDASEAWVPLPLAGLMEDRSLRFLRVLGRLAGGAEVASAGRELTAIAGGLASAHPETNAGWSVAVAPLADVAVDPSFRRALWILLAVVMLVLLVGCGNVASLSIARATERRREMGVRMALGASRGRLVLQLLLESLVVTLAAGGLGLGLARLTIDLSREAGPLGIPRLDDVSVNGRVLVLTLAVSLVAAVFVGLLPALRLTPRPASELGGRALSSGGKEGARIRDALVMGQVAISTVLLVGAILLLRSLERLHQVDVGFEPAAVLHARVTLPEEKYGTPEAILAFHEALVERTRGLPGVSAAGATSGLPFSDANTGLYYAPADRPPLEAGQAPDLDFRIVTPEYFETMGIPLLAGRTFDDADAPAGEPVVVVSRSLAERHWEGSAAVGRRIRIGDVVDGAPHRIVGVVDEVRHYGLEEARSRPQAYLSLAQRPQSAMTLVAKSSGRAGGAAAVLRATLADLDPSLPPLEVRAMEAVMSDVLARPRFQAWALGLFASAAVLLASIGLYGLTALLVAARTPELGLRIAMGARPIAVVRSITLRGVRLAAAGVLLGGGASLLLGGLVEALLYEVDARDASSLASAACLLVAVAALACFVPARRAARIDPVQALRDG